MDKYDQILKIPYKKTTLAGGIGVWKKVIIRPVVIKGDRLWQFSYLDEKKDISKNYDDKTAIRKLDGLRGQKYKIVSMVSVEDLSHDRTKKYILPVNESTKWLELIGIQTIDGNIKANQRDKWEQINQFLKNLNEVWVAADHKVKTLNIVDYGCGNAYLTFATAYYFKEVLKLPFSLTGIDINDELIARNSKIAQSLDWSSLKFLKGDIETIRFDFDVDIAMSLHACDIATDKAIEKAVEAKANIILLAPCCHHLIQTQLKSKSPLELIFEDGILIQRLGDIVTDALRAGWLRKNGYKTDVVQFVDSKHTPKNLMIRAVKKEGVDIQRYGKEYQNLVEYLEVKPYLKPGE